MAITIAEAQHQRVIWDVKGKPPCRHPEIENEAYPTGECTGFWVCTTCGEYIEDEN